MSATLPNTPPTTGALLAFAHQLADAAGAVIRPYFGQSLAVDAKADDSPVSIADREAEATIRALIAAHYPEHAFFGEESGSRASASPYTWVIDPIDGTRAFLAGTQEWGTLIALCEHGIPILGILDQPVTRERWVGMAGVPTTYNRSAVHVRHCDKLTLAEMSSTSARYFTPVEASHFVMLADQCVRVIEDGDCYAYGLLARGERDLVIDAGLKPYDILALVPIIMGAGGVISHWDGAAVTMAHYANIVAAANPELHQEALAILGKSL